MLLAFDDERLDGELKFCRKLRDMDITSLAEAMAKPKSTENRNNFGVRLQSLAQHVWLDWDGTEAASAAPLIT